MVLKTFSVQEKVYMKFSKFCKDHGVSMSKQIDMFMESVITEEPKIKKKYLDKLERIKKGKFIKIENFNNRYEL